LEKQVFVIAHSLLVNYFAKVAVQQKVKKYYRRLHTTENSSGDHGQTFERKNQVSTALKLLPPARKKILILKAVHDYSNHDIARQLNISVKTVEDHVSKAFRRIRQAMLSLV
jgi:RNA polymerase sigma factor (sigma-70 family)